MKESNFCTQHQHCSVPIYPDVPEIQKPPPPSPPPPIRPLEFASPSKPIYMENKPYQMDDLEDTIHIVILAHGRDFILDDSLKEKYKNDVRMLYSASNDTFALDHVNKYIYANLLKAYQNKTSSVDAVKNFVTSCTKYTYNDYTKENLLYWAKKYNEENIVKNAIHKKLYCRPSSLVVDRYYEFYDEPNRKDGMGIFFDDMYTNSHDGGIFVLRCRKDGTYLPMADSFEKGDLLSHTSSGNMLLDQIKGELSLIINKRSNYMVLTGILDILHKHFSKIVVYDLACRNIVKHYRDKFESPNKIAHQEENGLPFIKNLTMVQPKLRSSRKKPARYYRQKSVRK